MQAAFAAGAAPATVGSRPDWQFGDFFKLSASDEDLVKRDIANHLKLRYSDCNPTEPCALSVDGIKPYNPSAIENMKKDHGANAIASVC